MVCCTLCCVCNGPNKIFWANRALQSCHPAMNICQSLMTMQIWRFLTQNYSKNKMWRTIFLYTVWMGWGKVTMESSKNGAMTSSCINSSGYARHATIWSCFLIVFCVYIFVVFSFCRTLLVCCLYGKTES